MDLAIKYLHNFDDGDFVMYDEFKNEVYREDEEGYFTVSAYDSGNNLLFREDNDGIFEEADREILISETKSGIFISKPYGDITETLDCVEDLLLDALDEREEREAEDEDW